MECELILRHGIVFTGRKFEAKDVGIRRGKIAAIGKGLKGRKEIDCRGRLVLPAALDAHVHVRDFNEAYKEDWKSASRAAAHGGVSCLFDMPNNKGFAIDTLQRLRQKEKRALKQHFLRTAQRRRRDHALSVMAPSFIRGISHRR